MHAKPSVDARSSVRTFLFVVFALSGFAGLIYESLWSHYLKLFLGHAAYAQTLVLVLFMGGMALGAGLCGRLSARLASPLAAYAAVEFLLGVLAFGFDPTFRLTFGWVLQTAAPAITQPLVFEALKWSVAALLILPACVLLGATFPLISAGVLRLNPAAAGNAMGWLYFSNSLGAVVGVLTSGFVLIAHLGLPGTLLTAGLCNFMLALVAYGVHKRVDTPVLPLATGDALAGTEPAQASRIRILLTVAFLTGTASFLYEIGWIRMLSLVLGSATHSFELMLAGFILGLALGALWIRNRGDRVTDPMRMLAWVQVLMGTAALGTLVVYGWSFHWMADIVRTLEQTELGYRWFTLLSQGICLALMLPVTFFAGMTLPLLTVLALRTGVGESAIGRVYSANTWGAIVGVVVAVNLAMPLLGLRNVVVLGALVDVLLGLWLFSRSGLPSGRVPRTGLVFALAAGLALAVGVRFDPLLLGSGVFREGGLGTGYTSIWRRDGRTASVDLVRQDLTGAMSIKTNGKVDAALDPSRASGDDFTMILAGTLPLALRPTAEQVAVIGMGSGRSTHTFLGSPNVRTVDTIEIEPAMIEGARHFGPMVERTFNDPRSAIHVEDAKAFFARGQKRYDIIMSEPSNPWVSGVASLFSQEFYHQVKSYVADDGIFVQWLQLYEFDDQLLASVINALGQEFADYVIYAADDFDFLIVAVPKGRVPEPDAAVLQWPGIQPLADTIGVRQMADLRIRRIGSKAVIAPFAKSLNVPTNSDYFPFLDQSASKYRYIGARSTALSGAHPVLHRLQDEPFDYSRVTPVELIEASKRSASAFALWTYQDWKHVEKRAGPSPTQDAAVIGTGTALDSILSGCDAAEVSTLWLPAVREVGLQWWSYLEPKYAKAVVDMLRAHRCTGPQAEIVDAWLDWFDVVASSDWARVAKLGNQMLEQSDRSTGMEALLLREVLLADYRLGGPEAIRQRLRQWKGRMPTDPSIRYLVALSGA